MDLYVQDSWLTGFGTLAENDHHIPLQFGYYNKNSTYQKGETSYVFLRFNKFLSNKYLILNRRLTPGFTKQGRRQLVGVDWR
jgi:hypothetical protein